LSQCLALVAAAVHCFAKAASVDVGELANAHTAFKASATE
jgi:hypothetical protein